MRYRTLCDSDSRAGHMCLGDSSDLGLPTTLDIAGPGAMEIGETVVHLYLRESGLDTQGAG
mgnify:CR=1 FL=1